MQKGWQYLKNPKSINCKGMQICKRPKTERSVWQTKQNFVRFEIVPKHLRTEQNRFGTGLELLLCLTNQTILFGFQTAPKSELFGNQRIWKSAEIRTFGFQTFSVLTNDAQLLTPYRFEFKTDANRIRNFLSASRFEPGSLGWTKDASANSATPPVIFIISLTPCWTFVKCTKHLSFSSFFNYLGSDCVRNLWTIFVLYVHTYTIYIYLLYFRFLRNS